MTVFNYHWSPGGRRTDQWSGLRVMSLPILETVSTP